MSYRLSQELDYIAPIHNKKHTTIVSLSTITRQNQKFETSVRCSFPLSSKYYHTVVSNRHRECGSEKIEDLDAQVVPDVDLMHQMTVLKNRNLKAKPAVEKGDKKRLIQSFNLNKHEFLRVTPMQTIYDLFKNRSLQRERDRKHQMQYFEKENKHLTKAILYTVQQLLSNLTFEDHFKVQLKPEDFAHYQKRNKTPIDYQKLSELQFSGSDFNRKIQLVQNVFKDPHLNAKDREILYQVLLYQIDHALKTLLKIEKASLSLFKQKKESHLQSLYHVKAYIQENFDQLVKLL